MPKLTKSIIEAAKSSVSVELFLWDSTTQGFCIRILKSGTGTFLAQYRNAEGRSRRFKIGRYGILSVDEARARARVILGNVAGGADPMQERIDKRQAPTVADICDWYLAEAEAGRLLGRRGRPIKQSSLRMDRSRIERHIKPLLGKRQVRALRTPDVERFQTDVATGATSSQRKGGRGRNTSGGAGAASRSISTLHSLLEHAVRMGQIERNPAHGVRRIAPNRRTRRLSSAEYVALGQALRESAEPEQYKVGLAVVRLLLLTGFRRNEAQQLQRSWVDRDSMAIRFPDTKSGAQIRPISSSALAVIDGQPPVLDNPYVFVSAYGDDFYSQVHKAIVRLCRVAKVKDVTAHVFRHSFASVAGDLGLSDVTIAGLLGHGARGVTQGYIHIDEGLRLAAEKVAGRISDLLDGRAENIRDDIRTDRQPAAPPPATPAPRIRSWQEVRSVLDPDQ